MVKRVMGGRLAAAGLEVLVPGEGDRDLVHRVAYDERVRQQSRRAYRDAVDRRAARGVRRSGRGARLHPPLARSLRDPARGPHTIVG
ncbi:hypothetical protein [Blastococcus sp. SYSU DS0973]